MAGELLLGCSGWNYVDTADKGEDVLGVHVQGDQKFSMYKQWGHGYERLVAIYPEYENMIIRWGKEEVVEAVIKGNKRDNDDDGNNEFLY